MEEKLAKLVEFVITDVFGKDAELYEDYSGRVMFGNTTTGIVVEEPGYVFAALGYVMALDDADQLVEFFGHEFGRKWFRGLENLGYFDIDRLKVDSMGRRYIVY